MNRSFTSRMLRGVKFVGTTLGVAGLLLSASCAPAVDTSAMAKHLTQLDDDWSKAAATKHADAVASFYAEDAIAYPPSAPVAIGRLAAQKVWAAGFADSTYAISWKTVTAGAAASGDLGFTAGTFEESFKGPDGKLVNAKGKYLCVWRREKDGGWKAIHDTWNYDAK